MFYKDLILWNKWLQLVFWRLYLNVSILFRAVLNTSLFLYLAGHVSKVMCYDPLFCDNSFVLCISGIALSERDVEQTSSASKLGCCHCSNLGNICKRAVHSVSKSKWMGIPCYCVHNFLFPFQSDSICRPLETQWFGTSWV